MGLIFLFTLPILAAWQGDSELNNLESLGSSDINYDKQPVFEDLNNQLLASLYEEPTFNSQEEVKVPI